MDNNDPRIVFINGKKIVEINTIIFSGKRKIDWDGVEKYLKKYVGKSYVIDENDELIYIGSDFPDEYAHSRDSSRALSQIGRAKANITQVIPELIKIASNCEYQINKGDKHATNAKYGWYRCDIHFSMPITRNTGVIIDRSYYRGRMIIRHSSDGNKYLYDIINIKKET